MYRKRGQSYSDQLSNHVEPRKNARTEFNQQYIDPYVPGGTPQLAPGVNWDVPSHHDTSAVGSGEWVVQGTEGVEPNNMHTDHARAMENHEGAATEQGGAAAEQGGAVAEQGGAVADQEGAAAEQGDVVADQEGAAAQHENTVADDEDGCTDDSEWEDDYVEPPPVPKKPPVKPRWTAEQILSFAPYKYDLVRSEMLLLARRELLKNPALVELPDIWGGPLSVPDKVEMLFLEALGLLNIKEVSYQIF